jgi:hypothetical protein
MNCFTADTESAEKGDSRQLGSPFRSPKRTACFSRFAVQRFSKNSTRAFCVCGKVSSFNITAAEEGLWKSGKFLTG